MLDFPIEFLLCVLGLFLSAFFSGVGVEPEVEAAGGHEEQADGYYGHEPIVGPISEEGAVVDLLQEVGGARIIAEHGAGDGVDL